MDYWEQDQEEDLISAVTNAAWAAGSRDVAWNRIYLQKALVYLDQAMYPEVYA